MRFKRILLIILSGIITNLYAVNVQAIPTLQLDIGGGSYDSSTDTIVSANSSFTIYAYLITNSHNSLGDTYYISAALSPRTSEPISTGSDVLGDNAADI